MMVRSLSYFAVEVPVMSFSSDEERPCAEVKIQGDTH